MEGLAFRPLRADEIEVRVGQIGKTGATLLLYKNARVDMTILDEVVGPYNWQRSHEERKGNLYCRVGIFDKSKNAWVWKEDCGTESNTEKEKGEASDSFKRACVNWGIGRELYSGPRILVKCETKLEGNKYKLANPWEFYGAYVRIIETEELDSKRIITSLAIAKDGKDIYRWKYGV